MADDGNTRDEVVRLTQQLVVEGTKFMAAFAAAHRLHHTDAEALTRVLIAQEQGEPVTAGVLAEELGLTTGAITGLVDRLERAGHLSRVRDEQDRRKVLLQHSSGGRALADEFFIPVRERSEVVMDQFSPTELEVVRRYLAATGAAVAAHREALVAQSQKP